jgi:exopolysaccharide biosynthesis polyprenyl glycosylphosphotransferase
MIKEKEQLLRRLLMGFDILVVFFSFLATYILRQNDHIIYALNLLFGNHAIGKTEVFSRYLSILLLIIFAWWIALISCGLYRSFRRKHFLEIVRNIIKSTFFVIVIFGTIAFIFKLDFVSRSLVIASFFITSLSLIIERWVLISFLRYLRKKGYSYKNMLVVGTGTRAEKFIKLVHKHDEWGLRIIGLIDPEKDRLGNIVCGEKVIGVLEDIPRILIENVVDEVMFIVPRKWISLIEKSLFACEIQGVKTNIATDFFNMKIARCVSSDIENMPFVGFNTTEGEEWQLLLKRIFDIIISSVLIVFLSPLFVTLVVLIKYFSQGPAVFKQVRSGLNGRKFVMYKFRTMVNGAEHKQDELRAFNEMSGPVFKMRNDPRVTRFGTFLRRSSLDELPQLFNVFKGEMSLVGPRPPLPSEIDKYEIWQRRRLSMKPGLTCLWQTNGRNHVDFEKWMKLDLEYIDKWSLGLDFKILLKTIPAVLFSIGAR